MHIQTPLGSCHGCPMQLGSEKGHFRILAWSKPAQLRSYPRVQRQAQPDLGLGFFLAKMYRLLAILRWL